MFDHFCGQPAVLISDMISHTICFLIVGVSVWLCVFSDRNHLYLWLCVFSDRNLAMVYTEQLPEDIDPELWRTHGWSMRQCTAHSRSGESEERCQQRTQLPPRDARDLLRRLRESQAMWLGLRRHLDVNEATFVLQVLAEHSGWEEVKSSHNELNRRLYFRLCDECRLYNPQWEHTAMKRRQIDASLATEQASQAAAAASTSAAADPESEEFWNRWCAWCVFSDRCAWVRRSVLCMVCLFWSPCTIPQKKKMRWVGIWVWKVMSRGIG